MGRNTFLFLIQILMLAHVSFAQVVTSSFDNTIICENPAAAATRVFGIVTPFISYTQIDQKIEDVANGTPFTWSQKISIQRYEAIYAGKKSRFVPEIYISQNTGRKRTDLNTSEFEFENKVDMFNNHANFGYSVNDRLKIGLKFFQPSMSYKYDERYVFADDYIRTIRSDVTYTEMGFGGGLTYQLSRNFSIGGFYTNIAEKRKGEFYFKDGAEPEQFNEYNQTSTIFQNGVGVAYQVGDAKSKGFRAELSWTTMKYPYENEPKNNSVGRLSLEATQFGFTGGLRLIQSSGKYVNYRYFIDSVLSESEGSDQNLSYGGFFGFKSKGGSAYSGTFSYSSGKDDIVQFNQSTPGKVTRLNIGLSYAYYF